jgi:predicted transcriptional regulator
MFDFGIGEIVGAGTALAGAGFGIWKKRQLGKVVKEVFDVVKVYRAAKADGTITPDEVDKIIDELEEAVKALLTTFRSV